MLSLCDEASIADALCQPIDAHLEGLIATRLAQAQAAGLSDLTHILVIEPGDTEDAIIDAIGFSPLTSTLDGARFGSRGFVPFWSWLHDVGGWYEMIVTVGDSGFAYLLFIKNGPGTIPDLLALCEFHARGEP